MWGQTGAAIKIGRAGTIRMGPGRMPGAWSPRLTARLRRERRPWWWAG